MLQGPGRDLWRGRKLEHVGPGQWRPEFVDGEAVQATAEEWEVQFTEFYEAKDGFNVTVNPDHVARVARALEDSKTGLVRNLEEDPSLAGTVMDRMAYGGDFTALLQAAKDREGIFDGEKNEQFASAGTRRARSEATRQLDAFETHGLGGLNGMESAEIAVDASVVKRDVIVPDTDGAARSRGAGRRSVHAVGVGARRPTWTPSYEADPEKSDDDYGMGS
jgi:hypothetical protein